MEIIKREEDGKTWSEEELLTYIQIWMCTNTHFQSAQAHIHTRTVMVIFISCDFEEQTIKVTLHNIAQTQESKWVCASWELARSQCEWKMLFEQIDDYMAGIFILPVKLIFICLNWFVLGTWRSRTRARKTQMCIW